MGTRSIVSFELLSRCLESSLRNWTSVTTLTIIRGVAEAGRNHTVNWVKLTRTVILKKSVLSASTVPFTAMLPVFRSMANNPSSLVLDFRTFGHFRFKSNLEDCLLKALNLLNLQLLTLRQQQVNAIRNVVENKKWPEVLKSRTSNRVSPDRPGPRAQAPRKLWGREWLHRRCIWR